MNEKPILFSAPMVRAILAGDKTQTRRQVKYQRGDDCFVLQDYGDGWWPYSSTDGETANVDGMEYPYCCPYGTVSDRLYVRETFYAYGRWESRFSAKKKRDEWHFVDMTTECDRLYQYDTEHITPEVGRGGVVPAWHKRPSLFMPRAASRILLEIKSARVERLQDISEQDALAEGIEKNWTGDPAVGRNGFGGQGWVPDCGWLNYTEGEDGDPAYTPEESFRSLWESVNGADSWAANPWVWVVEFERTKA